MLLPSGNSFKCHGEVLYLQPMIPPDERFDISPPDWRMLSSRRVLLFFKHVVYVCKRKIFGPVHAVEGHMPILGVRIFGSKMLKVRRELATATPYTVN